MNEDEALALSTANTGASTAAAGLERVSGEEVAMNRENILLSNFYEDSKNGLGVGKKRATYLRGHCAEVSHESRHRHDVDEEGPNQTV